MDPVNHRLFVVVVVVVDIFVVYFCLTQLLLFIVTGVCFCGFSALFKL